MKVLYIHQHFKIPQIGGGIRSYEFAQRLIQNGHEVTMICGGFADFHLNTTKKKNVFRGNIDGIDVIQILLPYSNSDNLIKRTKTFLQFAFKSITFALHEDYDIAFATTTPLTAGIPCIIAKWFRRKPYIFEVRDLWPELPKALGMKNPIALWGMSILEKCSYRNAKACLGLSPGIKEGIIRRSRKGKQVEMIPNGCDLDIFYPGDRKNLKLNGVQENDTVAVFTGAHGIANGLDAVLDTAKVLLERGRNNIKLVFIGNGKLKPHLIQRTESERLTNCLFLNPMPKAELNQIISSADIGMMVLANIPAFYYGTSPNKFFDYISSGLPVINNYPGWLADIIKQNKCGIVVKPDDPEEFADGLIFLADHPEYRKEYGTNSRKLAEKEFDRNKLGNQFVNFIEKVYNKD